MSRARAPGGCEDTHVQGKKAESSFCRNESPRDLSRVTALMHHACGHFAQKHEPIIPFPEDFLLLQLQC